MKTYAIPLSALALMLADCSSEEQRLEGNIAEQLAGQGNVQQVDLTKQGNDDYNGFASVRQASGALVRLTCNAHRTDGSFFEWHCFPPVDQNALTTMQETIRRSLTESHTDVVGVTLTRRDDNSMTGYADVRDGAGNVLRAPCTATRLEPNSAQFRWECRPPEGQAATAAPGEATAPAQDVPPPDGD